MEKYQQDGLTIYAAWSGEMTPRSRFQAIFTNGDLSHQFEKAIVEFKPDLVHVQHLMGLPASLATKLSEARIPYVATLHDYFYFCANAQLLTNYDDTLCEGPKAWLNCARCTISRAGMPNAVWAVPPLMPLLGWRNRLLGKALDGAAKLIVPTRFVKQVYGTHGVDEDKIVVIPYGIAPPDEATQRLIAKRPSFQTLPLKVVYVGGIAPQKGVDVLVTAVSQLPPDQIRCRIYGDFSSFPEYVGQLRQQINQPNIKLEGKLPREQLWDALLKADLLVVPSVWHETSSIIIDEAFAAGLPVLASKLGGMTEKIVPGQNGFQLTPGDADELATHFKRFVADPSLLNQLRPLPSSIRTIHQHADEVEQLYDWVISP